MAVLTIFGLKRADELLDQLSRSQSQLVQVTRLKAEIERLRADAGSGDAAAATRDAQTIDQQLRTYLDSISAEGSARSHPDPTHQVEEARDGQAIADGFAAMRAPLLQSQAPPVDQRQRFEALAQSALTRERVEAADAINAMRNLRSGVSVLGIVVAIVATGLGAAGAAVMLINLIRPLELLERATERAGDGRSPDPIALTGFAEFRRLAKAFDRMHRQIAAQHEHLQHLNQGLESQVAERTREIEASRKTLSDIDQVRRLFFSQIGHELRTPATVIRGEAEVALRDPLTSAPRLREALEHVAANGAFLQRRLEDMLALAKADDGRIDLRCEPLNVRVLVADAADLAGPYVRSSGANLVTQLPAGPGPTLNGDASWLKQAMLAVIDNAAKFAGETTIQISLRAEPGEAVIRVTDGGPGVQRDDLPKLFDSHFQTAAGRSRGGSGLGLSVTKWVVQQHGGSVTAFNQPGEGMSVEIRLPILA